MKSKKPGRFDKDQPGRGHFKGQIHQSAKADGSVLAAACAIPAAEIVDLPVSFQ